MALEYIFRFKNRLFIFTFLLIGLLSCSSSPELVQIRLRLKGIEDQWVYLCQWNGSQNVVVDSAWLNSRGKAMVELYISTTDLYAITINKQHYPIVVVVNPGARISIEGDLSAFSIVGSRESSEINAIQGRYDTYTKEIGSLRGQLPDSVNLASYDSISKIINLRIDSLKVDAQSVGRAYVKGNMFSLSSILVLMGRIDHTEVFPYSTNRGLFIKLDSCLNTVYSDKPLVKSFSNYIYSQEKLYDISRVAVVYRVGDVIPPSDFNLIDGRTVTIPGLWAKLILIDFWSSWCSSCENQPHKLRQINNDFAPKGLQIIQVAANFNADSLLAISARDSLHWMHMAESDPYNSRLFKSLGVIKLPSNLLVDRWGRVVATNIYGDSLTSKLHSILDVKIVKPKRLTDSTSIKSPEIAVQ